MAAKLKPTRGESLLIWRRRKNLTQAAAAKSYSVTPDRYREWEADKRKIDQPRYSAGKLKPHEVCYLLRRRAGKLQYKFAAELGVTKQWLIQMEDGRANSDRLRAYWGV